MKSEKQIALYGLNSLGKRAKVGDKPSVFTEDSTGLMFTCVFDDLKGTCELTTNKGKYTLIRHNVKNLWTGLCAETKVHISKKVLVGKLIYWA